MSENYEVIEGTVEETNNEELECCESESKKGLGLAAVLIGGGLALGGLAVAGVKKLKDKKADKPKKQKTKLKLVRVPVEEESEELNEEVEASEETK